MCLHRQGRLPSPRACKQREAYRRTENKKGWEKNFCTRGGGGRGNERLPRGGFLLSPSGTVGQENLERTSRHLPGEVLFGEGKGPPPNRRGKIDGRKEREMSLTAGVVPGEGDLHGAGLDQEISWVCRDPHVESFQEEKKT